MSPDPVMPPWLVDSIPFTDETLDAAYDSTHEYDETVRAAIEAWQPADDEQAEAIMARLAWNQQKLTELDDRKKGYTARITEWFEKDARPIRRRVQRYQDALKAYGVEYRRATRKATLNLPSGVVSTQDQAPTVQLPNTEAGMASLIEWAKRTPQAKDVVKVTEEVLISQLRAVTRVEQMVTGQFASYGLGCGHSMETGAWLFSEGDPPEDMYRVVGEMARCPRCSERVPVADVEVVQLREAVVLGPDDHPVPGVVVAPGGIVALTPKPGRL